MAKFTNHQLVAFVKMLAANKVPYWYGTCVYPCTTDLLTRKAAQYPGHYTSSRMKRYRTAVTAGTVCCDCVGMIKGFFWTGGGAGVENYIKGKGTYKNKYASNDCPDKSANGMYEYCRKNAPKKYGTDMDEMPDVPGLFVWSSGHIGVYIGGGKVVEARGFAYGVVTTELSKRPWKAWMYAPSDLLEYEDASLSGDIKPGAGLFSRDLKKGMEGQDVREMQELLIAAGYDCGKCGADGDFGKDTDKAVKKFQKDMAFTINGIYTEEVHRALFSFDGTIKNHELGSRLLKKGMEGTDVQLMQSLLISKGYDCGKCGSDGEYGSATVSAVKEFQRDYGLVVDGQYGSKSHAALMALIG